MKGTTRICKKWAAAMMLVCFSSGTAMAANKLIVKDSTGTTDKFVVTDAGQIGSGTASPASAVHVQGNSYATTQFIAHWNGTLALNGGGGFVGLYNNDNSGLPLKKDRLGYFLFGTMYQGSKLIGGGMNVNVEQNWTGISVPTYLTFLTAPEGSKTTAERVRITSSGNLGVGTTAPNQKLEVNGGIRMNYTGTTKPNCDSTDGSITRGTLWVTKGATGVADTLEICIKTSAGNYAWKAI